MYRLITILTILYAFTTSCIPHKKIVLFQNEGLSKDSIVHYKFTYKVQPNDVLGIVVSNFYNQTTDFFNLKTDKEFIKGYTVNHNGFIHIPMLDSFQVGGQTLAEIEKLVKVKLKDHVVDPYVVVKLLNFKFTALGEVNSKGIIPSQEEELTIIEALGLAGDLTDFADRKNVKIIRTDGKSSKFITIDLTDRDILASEFFYLQPNDVLYVEPLKVKAFRANIASASLYLSIFTITYLLISRFR